MANTPSAGGALLPYQDQRLKGNLTVDGNVTVTGTITGTSTGDAFASPTITGTVAGAATYSTPTLTTPVIATGLSASGSAANDFSASTGTFKTSSGVNTISGTIAVAANKNLSVGAGTSSFDFSGGTGTFLTSSGANTLSGAVSIADATTPSVTTASGKTNTGFFKVNGKTSGSLKIIAADATAQDITLATAAQTSGAATLTIPDMAGSAKTIAWLQSPSFTTPVLGVATGTSLAATGAITSSSASAGIGYATSAGGTGTQGTDKTTTVVMSPNPCMSGTVTVNAATLNAATIVSFDVTDSAVAATDVIIVNHLSGGTIGAYTVNAHGAAGKFTVTIRNNTAGNLSEAPVLAFAVIKAVTA